MTTEQALQELVGRLEGLIEGGMIKGEAARKLGFELRQAKKALGTESPIMWKLGRKESTRIACHCGKPARFGRTADGGAPYFYECSSCIPVGSPVEMCNTTAEVVAAVEARN